MEGQCYSAASQSRHHRIRATLPTRFSFTALEELGRPPNRTVLAKNVKNANEEFEILLLHKVNADGRL